MSINQRIKLLRQELNLSQAKFAKEISISNGYIAGIELENRKVNDRIIKLICVTFNVNEEWLRNGTGNIFLNQTNDEAFNLASGTFQKLKPVYQNYILKQIDQLLEIQYKETDSKVTYNDGHPDTPEELEKLYPPVDIKNKDVG